MSTLQERLNKARNIKNVVDPSKLNVQEQQVTVTYTDEFLPFKERVHQEILDQINFNNALRSDSNKEEVKNLIRMTVDNLGGDIPRPIKTS